MSDPVRVSYHWRRQWTWRWLLGEQRWLATFDNLVVPPLSKAAMQLPAPPPHGPADGFVDVVFEPLTAEELAQE